MRSILKAVQADVLGTLNACDYFDDITIVAEDNADLATIIVKALSPVAFKGGKTGLVVIVNEPEAQAVTTVPAPYFDTVRQKITVLENAVVNRTGALGTGKSGYLVAETILQLLWLADFAGTTNGPSWPGNPAIRPLGAIADSPEMSGVQVMVEMHAGMVTYAKCATPVITQGGSTTSITSATSGATILYSLDGAFPSQTYSVAFANPAVGVMVRACAKKTLTATSHISMKIIT